ncbi:DUF2142 domain-containing protein, partial [Microbacterium sp. C448]|uniref:DUF2142 domain-containing protein n=1 Tax=Microbacterium sp. C448 TaxID=1177594 RepID=UPI00130EFB2C
VFAVFGAIVAAILAARWSKALIAPAVTAVLIAVASVAFYMTSGQSSAVVTGLAVGNPPLSFIQHLTNFLNIPGLWTGALGGWGLGWLDTIMPAVVPTLSVAVAAGAIFIGVRTLTWRRATALAVALIAMWLVPLALLAQSRVLVGSSVQPRYILPLLIIALGVATAASHAERWWSGPRGLLAAAALSVAAAVALHTNVRRYTTGIDMPALNPGRDAEWWWPGAPAPIVVWAVGSAAFAVALFLLARSARAVRTSSETRPEQSSTPPAVNA